MKKGAIVKTFKIKNKLGLHARAASRFVEVANRYDFDIFVKKDDREVNGKSIMGVLILSAACGSEITIRGLGKDAAAGVDAIGALIDRGFDENDD
jgi:phosphocarrier protein